MKTLQKYLALFVFTLLALVGTAHAQATLASTTLTSAITGTAYGNTPSTTIVLGAVTNIVAPSASTAGTVLYVDKEMMTVTAVNSTTLQVQVLRGQGGTAARSHNAAAVVWYGPPNYFTQKSLSGSCTLTSDLVTPNIDTTVGIVYWCYDGLWASQPSAQIQFQNATGRFRYSTVPVGSVAYGSFGNATTTVAGTTYCADVTIPRATTLTGIGVLNNGTIGTDKGLVILYDSTGVLVARSAAAGTTTVGANAFQDYAFTATVNVLGPADYYACYQSNGTTDGIRTVAASTFIDVLTKSVTGTFATIINPYVVPTTFTANVGPVAYVY